jgi:hypothetical protein
LGSFGSLAFMITHGNNSAFGENVTDLLVGCKRSKLGNNQEDAKDMMEERHRYFRNYRKLPK